VNTPSRHPRSDGALYRFYVCRAPSSTRADPFELLEIHGRAWHPDIVSRLACVHLSIFEHAERDRLIEQSVRCVGAEAPFAWMRLILRASSIAGLCSGLSRRRSQVRARFSRVHLAQKWAPERTPSGGFSFPADDDEEFRGERGKRVNRPPDSNLRPSISPSKAEHLTNAGRGQALRTAGPIQRGDPAGAQY
jgi:hypothetical protein